MHAGEGKRERGRERKGKGERQNVAKYCACSSTSPATWNPRYSIRVSLAAPGDYSWYKSLAGSSLSGWRSPIPTWILHTADSHVYTCFYIDVHFGVNMYPFETIQLGIDTNVTQPNRILVQNYK